MPYKNPETYREYMREYRKGWKTVNLRKEIYSKLEKKAKKENRDVTNLVEIILLEAVAE